MALNPDNKDSGFHSSKEVLKAKIAELTAAILECFHSSKEVLKGSPDYMAAVVFHRVSIPLRKF